MAVGIFQVGRVSVIFKPDTPEISNFEVDVDNTGWIQAGECWT